MLDAPGLAAIGEAARAEVLASAAAFPQLSADEKTALKAVETPLISAEGVFLKAFVAAALGRVPVIGGVLAALVAPLIDQGLALERQKLDEALA